MNEQVPVTFQIVQNSKCSICLNEKTECFTPCFHHFHFKYLLKWLNLHKTCPMCRRECYHRVIGDDMNVVDIIDIESLNEVAGLKFYEAI